MAYKNLMPQIRNSVGRSVLWRGGASSLSRLPESRLGITLHLEGLMFGIIGKSKRVASFVSAAVLASALIAPAAIAGPFSAGNSSEIPFSNTNAYYSTGAPTQVIPGHRVHHGQAPVVQRSTTNSSCPGGYTWSDSMAGNGMSIPTRCHS
jgi:hypothetical protein